ncbi:urease accessory protein [Dyadobacter soli]|uniref:Urease accessory protein UreF n=1 Tax=Dyadobacter soli TaxID=659014 RepID=A0A1G7Q1E2_9BACT|nr:urease accessory protein UreF [Dyadobacter soli]SDF92314.1 urease accessory protein [Dyadobacter soli]
MEDKNSQNTFLTSLLHLSDPTLPIGGYVHSNGLETYVQNGQVHSAATAREFVENMLRNNLKYNDAAFVRLAYEATAANDLAALIELDEECSALKSPREIREASQKLGLRLMKIFKRKQTFPISEQFESAVANGEADAHYCIAFGMFASLLGIPLQQAMEAFYYNAAAGFVTNSVKLVPLGQLDGQEIMFGLLPLMQTLAAETLQVDRALVGLCNTGLDIRCMQHERLYSRLYMS